MIITKYVLVKWSRSIKKHYESKGYQFTNYGNEFLVKVEDLSKNSHVSVEVKCDCEDCKNPIAKFISWQNYNKSVKRNGQYRCKKCANKEIIENTRLTKLKNGTSFEQWCIDNNYKDILKRWDYELNDYKPNEISYASNKKFYFKCSRGIHKSELKDIKKFTSGRDKSINCKQCNSFQQWCIDNDRQDVLDRWDYKLNKKKPIDISYGSHIKIWLKCPKNIHNSEPKNLKNFTSGQEGSLDCKQCNSFAQWGIDNLGEDFLEKYWDYNKNNKLGFNPWEISYGSKNQVSIICQENKTHKSYFTPCCNFTGNNSRCPECNKSKGEKRIDKCLINNNWIKILQEEFEQLINEDKYNKNYFIPQKEFDGLLGLKSGLLSYDFYIPKLNLLIEYQGIQHEKYIPGFHESYDDFLKQKEHDRRKREYAKINNIRLLEIWYYDFDNIEDILERELNLI